MKRFVMSGSSGLIGKALSSYLESKGDTVIRLVRQADSLPPGAIFWDPEKGELDPQILEGVDGVINLAGENIASGRWTKKRQQEILESRVNATKTLRLALEKVQNKPNVWINFSATGYYGYKRFEEVDEKSSLGSGFLAYVCRKWEEEALKGKDLGIRLVIPRLGVVLSRQGGMLKKMLLPFKLGLGGVIGTGDQPISWIAMRDLLAIIDLALNDSSIAGVINCVHPEVVTQRQFAKALGEALHRPTIFPMPSFAVRWIFGEMGEELILNGVKVKPTILLEKGFKFGWPDLRSFLDCPGLPAPS